MSVGDPALYKQRLYEYFGRLMASREQRLREVLLRNIFNYSKLIDEVKPAVAATLVQYTLYPKNPSEQELIAQNIDAWMRWKYYRLAMADALSGLSLPPAKTKALLEPLLQTEIDATEKDWQIEARVELMETARDRFQQPSSPTDSQGATIDAAAEYLLEILRLKGRLRGYVPDPQQDAIATPGKLLSATAQAYAQLLAANPLQPRPQQWLDNANRRLELVDYLANDDLGRTAAGQRAYLRIVAAEIVQQDGTLEQQVDAVLHQLDVRDQQAKSLLSQIRDAERTGIQLLRLRNPAQ